MQTLGALNSHLHFNKLPRRFVGLDSKSHQDRDFVLFTAVSQQLNHPLANSRCSVSILELNE